MKKCQQMKKKTEYKRVPESLLLAIFILICILGTTQMLAKFYRGAAGGNSARVATFQVSSEFQLREEIALELSPGNSETVDFSFTNTSETAVNMIAKVNSEGNLPVKISYQKVNNTHENSQESWAVLTGNLVEEWETIAGTGYLSWTDSLEVNSGTSNYQIKIEWPEDRTNYQYKQGVLVLKLQIDAQQAD